DVPGGLGRRRLSGLLTGGPGGGRRRPRRPARPTANPAPSRRRRSPMTRVLLINPPSPEQLGAPPLGQQYAAPALRAPGCAVRVTDAAARYFDHDFDWIVAEAEDFAPDLIGFGLFTRWVWHAYRLVEAFRGRFPLLVAGGAHATVRPDETLERGFDVA